MSQSEENTKQADFTLKETLNFLKDSGANYVQAKTELASIEASEAAKEVGKRVIFAVLLALVAFFSYLLLLVSLIGFFSTLLEDKLTGITQYTGTWPLITLAFFLLHLLFVSLFIDRLKKSCKTPLFEHTKAELQKDKLWLQQLKANNEN